LCADGRHQSLVDQDRIWFKSRVGINAEQTARDAGLCASAMLSQGVYHLRDAAQDQCAICHSFVTDLGIRFYSAAPLRTEDGLSLGTVWVVDQNPRELAAGEAEMLSTLSALAMNQLVPVAPLRENAHRASSAMQKDRVVYRS